MPPPSTADDTGWSAIVHEHGATVWRLARRLLDDEADAGDCFQETFVAALSASRSTTVAAEGPTPADALAGHELADHLRAALTALPRQQAEVFTLAVVEDVPHAEVAAMLERVREMKSVRCKITHLDPTAVNRTRNTVGSQPRRPQEPASKWVRSSPSSAGMARR